jgi:hypothetical protein
MNNTKKKKKRIIVPMMQTDVSANPQFNSDVIPEPEPTLEEILEFVFEENEKLIQSENKADEDN